MRLFHAKALSKQNLESVLPDGLSQGDILDPGNASDLLGQVFRVAIGQLLQLGERGSRPSRRLALVKAPQGLLA